MKYWQYTIAFQEVPDEISLAFEITGCKNNCEGCHSPHLQSDTGQELTFDLFKKIVGKYVGLITNVLFMGGEQYKELKQYLDYVKSLGIKTTLYTGSCDVEYDIKHSLDYLKTGRYIPELGALDAPTTNQRLVKLATGETIQIRKNIAQNR